MGKENIIQFVGFVTRMDASDFLKDWEHYSKEYLTIPDTTLLHQEAGANSRFQFISQHEFREPELSFAFMKNRVRSSRFFKEQGKIKVIQAGGYSPVQIGCRYDDNNTETMVMAFVGHDVNKIEYFRELPSYKYLNVYKEYYENCMYEYVLQFFSSEDDSIKLLEELRSFRGVDAAIYKECTTASTS